MDATIPTGATLGEDLPALVREARAGINLLTAAVAALGGAATYETLSLGAGATELPLTGAGIVHTIALGAAGGASLTDITGGREGQLLLIKATGANITFVHNEAKIHLNGALDNTMAANDFLCLLNESGDPDAVPAVDGIWIEVFRTQHV